MPSVNLHCQLLCLCLGAQLSLILGSVDEWQFDSFQLHDASQGRPLSCLAFHLFKRMDLVGRFHLNEKRLVRWAAARCVQTGGKCVDECARYGGR